MSRKHEAVTMQPFFAMKTNKGATCREQLTFGEEKWSRGADRECFRVTSTGSAPHESKSGRNSPFAVSDRRRFPARNVPFRGVRPYSDLDSVADDKTRGIDRFILECPGEFCRQIGASVQGGLHGVVSSARGRRRGRCDTQ